MRDPTLPIRQRLLSLARQLELEASGDLLETTAPRLRQEMPDEERKPDWWLNQARQIYVGRRLRERFLPAQFFGEAAWDMLLELFILDLHDQCASVKRACIASAVPMTTALRWIDILEQEDLVARSTSPSDKRVTWLSLTPKGAVAMRCYILELDMLRARPTPEMLLITRGRSK